MSNNPAATASLDLVKQGLRALVRQELAALPEAQVRAESVAVVDRLLGLPALASAVHVGVYASMPQGELDTHPLIRALLGQGKRVYLPRLEPSSSGALGNAASAWAPKRRMTMVEVPDWGAFLRLPLDRWGIKAPPPAWHPAERLELVVMPCLAMDVRGARLGHGRGYYDHWCTTSPQARGAVRVVVGLNCQLLTPSRIPMGPHDVRLGLVAHPGGLVEVGEADPPSSASAPSSSPSRPPE